MLEHGQQRAGVARDGDPGAELTGTAVPLEHIEPAHHAFVASAPVAHRPLQVVDDRRAVEADLDGERIGREQPRISGHEQGRVGGDREADAVAGGRPALGRIRHDRVNEIAIEQRLAAHEAEQEVGAGLRLCDQAIDRLSRDIGRHHSRLAAESSLVGVAIAARHVAGLRDIERDRAQRRSRRRAFVYKAARRSAVEAEQVP